MAHYARLEENIVTQVTVYDGEESEALLWLTTQLGGAWVVGVKDVGQRAGIGFSYDETRDCFIPPKPYDSWVLNEDTCLWEPPVALPVDADTVAYSWDEDAGDWVAVPETPEA